MSFDLRRSRQTLFGQSADFLIGELLLKAGIIKQAQLDEALKLAGNKHMQIGQMLIMARYITQKELQTALDAQAAIRDKLIDMNTALRIVTMSHHSNMTFAEASQKQSQESEALPPVNKLGKLLVQANLIDAEQLTQADKKSMATGLPLGRMLILNGVITDAILTSTLEMLIKLRDGAISHEEAIASLSDLSRTKEISELGVAKLEEASVKKVAPDSFEGAPIRLGEFLVLASILSETDVMNALEFSLLGDKPIGKTLVEHGYVTQNIVEAAVQLQSLIGSDSIDCKKAAKCLNHMHLNNVSLTEAMEVVSSEVADGMRIDLQTLLTDFNIVSSDDIQSALTLATKNPRILARLLNQTGYLNNSQMEIVIDCHEALIQNIISQQDAKFVIDYCLQQLLERPITFAEGLGELGWSKDGSKESSPAAEFKDSVQDMSSATFEQMSAPQPAKNRPTQQHTGRTTSNMPALNNMQAGSELMRSDEPFLDVTQLTSSEPTKSTGTKRSADKSLSLKALLKEEDNPTEGTKFETIDEEGFELSDSEKALIMKASSLTASPEEIMAAMKLAAKKEKTLHSHDQVAPLKSEKNKQEE